VRPVALGRSVPAGLRPRGPRPSGALGRALRARAPADRRRSGAAVPRVTALGVIRFRFTDPLPAGTVLTARRGAAAYPSELVRRTPLDAGVHRTARDLAGDRTPTEHAHAGSQQRDLQVDQTVEADLVDADVHALVTPDQRRDAQPGI